MIFAKISSDFRIKICFSATYHLEDIFLHGRLGLNHNFRKVAIKLAKNRWNLNFVRRYFNSKVAGWDSWVSLVLKSIFWGDPIFESAAWFFDIILKFIFTPIFAVQIIKKIFDTKKISFSKAKKILSRSFYVKIQKKRQSMAN